MNRYQNFATYILEVQGIADGEVAVGIQGKNPVTSGELTLEEIKRCEGDSTQFLNKLEDIIPLSSEINKKKKFYSCFKKTINTRCYSVVY